MRLTAYLPDATATMDLGVRLAAIVRNHAGGVMALEGPLGAGKTTLARGLLRALGVAGVVRSPTYTLLEPYETAAGTLVHLDLYRLQAANELLSLGLEDYASEQCWWLVEWPERAAVHLREISLRVRLEIRGDGREITIEGSRTLLEGLTWSGFQIEP